MGSIPGACLAARAPGVYAVAMTSTLSATNSAPRTGRRSSAHDVTEVAQSLNEGLLQGGISSQVGRQVAYSSDLGRCCASATYGAARRLTLAVRRNLRRAIHPHSTRRQRRPAREPGRHPDSPGQPQRPGRRRHRHGRRYQSRRSLHPLSPLTEGARATSCPMWSSGSISGIAPPPPERRRAGHGACERGGGVDRVPAGFALDSHSALHHSRGPGGGVT